MFHNFLYKWDFSNLKAQTHPRGIRLLLGLIELRSSKEIETLQAVLALRVGS